MIILKIIGLILSAIALIVFIILMLNAKIIFAFDTNGRLVLKAKLLFFTVYDLKRKKKKSGKIGTFLKKIFGIDTLTDTENLKTDAQTSGISSAVNKVVTVLMLLMGQIVWLLKRVKLKKLRLYAVCAGDDAADAAMDYGLVCSAVYPFVGYLETSLKMPKNACDIQVGCDFEGDAYFETEITAKLRVIHILRAIYRNAVDGIYEEVANEQR